MTKNYKPFVCIDSEIDGISGIYQIRNLVNNKIYVGSSLNLLKRKKQHFYELRNNRHDNIKLLNAYKKYGEENFIFEIIEITNKSSDILKLEQYWLDILNCVKNGYNINPIAKKPPCSKGKNNPMYGKHHTAKSKEANRIKYLGKGLYGDNPNAVKVICLDTGEIFDTIKQASEKFNISYDSVRKNCMGFYTNPKRHFRFYRDYIKEKI